ncbi:MAG: hypothetical protein ABL866_01235 [Devosia sp.]
MSLQKLARELDETARQTAVMVEGITAALEVLADKSLSCTDAKAQAVSMIVSALQGQDRIEQRCQNMALAVRQFALLPPTAPDAVYNEIWTSLVLDELRVPELSGIAAHHPSHGDVDLF